MTRQRGPDAFCVIRVPLSQMNLAAEWARTGRLCCCAQRSSDATPRLSTSGCCQSDTKRAAPSATLPPSWSRRQLFVGLGLGLGSVASSACAPASAEVCRVFAGALQCDAPQPDSNDFIDVLRDSTEVNKAAYDQQRLDAYYRREWRINKLVGREVLPEPCDPRKDPKMCEPNAGLPALPEDRRDGLIEGKGGRVYRLGTGEPVVAETAVAEQGTATTVTSSAE